MNRPTALVAEKSFFSFPLFVDVSAYSIVLLDISSNLSTLHNQVPFCKEIISENLKNLTMCFSRAVNNLLEQRSYVYSCMQN